MTLRPSSLVPLKSEKPAELKEFYDRSKLPPYLHAATTQKTSLRTPDDSQVGRSMSESHLKEQAGAAGEADAAAGSMLTRVRSFGRLKSPPPPASQTPEQQRPTPQEPQSESKHEIKPSWCLKDKTRSVGVGLVMALNIGTDPPDVTKPHPCAKLQTWMDPTSVSRAKAKEKIGERLQAQYAQWQQQRTATPLKYRRALDPTVEDVRALCLWLRRQARSDRILLHYNGHGVPRPTSEGELWLFDKNHTQYIPLSVTDLRQWMGKPNLVILDCSNAGVLMPFLTAPLEASNGTSEGTPPTTRSSSPSLPSRTSDMDAAASQWVSDTIVLCPTAENEWLPMHPDYPADIFTSCLTTPIQMALRWFVRCNPQSMGGLPPDAVDAIPGKSNDRKTPLGELTWVFAAVTDSIAWNVLPRPLFQRLLRQDSLVAGMFRNFLLADRILRSLNCSPQSYPPLPPGVCYHPLWEAWDLACETCLHGLMRAGTLPPAAPPSKGDDEETADATPAAGKAPAAKPVVPEPITSSVSSPFFSEQLSAFEIWLDFAYIKKTSPNPSDSEPFKSPEQLPIVLQVLLTPAYRVRALGLLRQFLDLGPWAVNLALSLGVLPYVTKLLQSPEYKQDLMGIWAKILAFDPSCQQSVLKDGGVPHFVSHLTWGMNTAPIAISMDPTAQQRTMAAFILSATCLDFPRGQSECIRLNLHGTCSSLLSSIEFDSGDKMDPDFEAKVSIAEARVPPDFRMWLCICLGCLVKDNGLVQNQAWSTGVHRRLLARISDNSPEVRAAACYALGCLIGFTNNPQLDPTTMALMSHQQQQLSANVQTVNVASQPSWISGRLLNPPNQVLGAGIPGRLQPTFAPGPTGSQPLQWQSQAPTGMAQQQPIQLPQVQPQLQQTGYNPLVVHPQSGLSTAGAVSTAFGGRPVDGSYFGRSQPSFLSPSFSHVPVEPHPQAPPVSEDGRSIAYDSSVIDGLLRATEDASPMVRYEAVVSLARLVEKYVSAFVTLADGLKEDSAEEQRSDVDETGEEMTSTGASRDLSGQAGSDDAPVSHGTEDETATKFAVVWNTLRRLQRHDPYPDVSSVASSVVSVVHEQILRIKLDRDNESGLERASASFKRSPGAGMSRSQGTQTSPTSRPEETGIRSFLSPPSASQKVNQDGRTDHRTDNVTQANQSVNYDKSFPRISSETAETSGWPQIPTERTERPTNRRSKSDGKLSTHDVRIITDHDFPASKFYKWQKDVFSELDTEASKVVGPIDPLSFDGAVKSYREQRNRKAHLRSKKDTEHFASLAPSPPKMKKKQRFNVDLSDEDEEAANAANEEAAKKKRELELKQTHCLTNTPSYLLRFHSYEDALLVCDGYDGVSLWDSRTGALASRFHNGNPKGSRMTSACWVNEHANSLFLIGCDDGSVRIWDGLVEPNGELSPRSPSLSTAFSAIPDMSAGGDSGLKLEWQQYSGRLIAGGNSDSLRCWDLGAEKCVSVLKTESEACVTTITTAWSQNLYGAGLINEGYQGIGPDVVVAGHKDGSIRIFDIRVNRPAVASSRLSRTMKYDEHRNWVVSARFTCYGGRPEVVSGSVDGEVKTWDLRLSASLRTCKAQRRTMTAMSVHPRIPLVATGSLAQFIKVMTLDGVKLQVIRYHEALGGHQMIGPVSCLEFHPHKPVLAAGGTDSIVSIYSPKTGSYD